jgi:hypothetical protein
MAKINPLVYKNDSHRPAGDGDTLKPSLIPVDSSVQGKPLLKNDVEKGLSAVAADALSGDADNALKLGGDGALMLRLSDVVSADGDSILELGTDKKLAVKPRELSTDEDNYLRYGNDGGFYISGSDILSDTAGNPLTTGADGKILLNPCLLPKIPPIVSEQAGNLITKDRADDSALLLHTDVVSPDAGNMIASDAANKLKVTAATVSSANAANCITVDDSGRLIVLPASIIDRGDGCLPDNLIVLSNANKLMLKLGLRYDALSGRLDLLDTHNAVTASVSIPTASSILESVTLEDNPVGQPEGRYLHFTFRKSDGTVVNTYVDMSSLKDVYTSGKGIEIHDMAVNVKLAPRDSGLSFDEAGCLQAGFTDLAGPGLVITEDPESLGKQFEVAVCEGITLTKHFTHDGTEVRAVAVNLDPEQKILGLVPDPDERACPTLGSKLEFTAASVAETPAAADMVLNGFDGQVVDTFRFSGPFTAVERDAGAGTPPIVRFNLSEAADAVGNIVVDADTNEAELYIKPDETDLFLGVNAEHELTATLKTRWDDDKSSVEIIGREEKLASEVRVPVLKSYTTTPTIAEKEGHRFLKVDSASTLADTSVVNATAAEVQLPDDVMVTAVKTTPVFTTETPDSGPAVTSMQVEAEVTQSDGTKIVATAEKVQVPMPRTLAAISDTLALEDREGVKYLTAKTTATMDSGAPIESPLAEVALPPTVESLSGTLTGTNTTADPWVIKLTLTMTDGTKVEGDVNLAAMVQQP